MRNRLIRFFHDYSPDIILALGAIAIFVLVPKLFGPLLSDNESKDSLDLALKLLGTFLAVSASIASYRRFFRGRIFAPRLVVDVASDRVCELSDTNVLHAIDVTVENVGDVTIWQPTLTVDVLDIDSDQDCTVEGLKSEGIRQAMKAGGIEGIEPAEKVIYHYRCKIPATVEAFKVSVDLVTDRRNAWHRTITSANQVS